jgi:altronate hydrolase
VAGRSVSGFGSPASQVVTPGLGTSLAASGSKAARYYATLGHGSLAPGNADGGLTTQEEKCMGAYSKSGPSPISGLLKPGDVPQSPGL